MGILDFLGGSSESGPTKQDKQMQKEVFDYAKEVGKIPYQPWAGLDVAAFNPQQDAAMQAYADMGNAFGMGMPTNITAGRPPTFTDASGNKGYSSFPAWMQNLEANKGTAAADRYSKFYDLSKDNLYGKTTLGSVTGLNPAGTGGSGTGGKGTGGTGTGGTGGSGGLGGGSGTGGKGLQPNTGIGNIMGLAGGTVSPDAFIKGFRRSA